MVEDVAAWLEGLGLSAYAAAFAENDVDGRTLPLLTAEDLQEIGVRSVGHRRRLLAAIAALAPAGPAPEPPALPPGPAVPPAVRPPVVERRQITVVFCDLVESTVLANRLDPEDLHDLLAAYRDRVSEAVERHRGFIAHHVGDGVFIYFGYPHAQERDAERALRAGLAIIGALRRFTPVAGVTPQVRIGVATGLVVVGSIGEGAAGKVDVTGETPNLAARLQGLAGPNEMVVAEGTRSLAGDCFTCADLGRFALKGLPEPVPAWRVAGERTVVSRYDAVHAGRRTGELIGREGELARIRDRLGIARDGAGQVVLVSAHPGFGKSRLVEEMHRITGIPRDARFVLQCSPEQVQTPFYPLVHQLEYVARIVSEDAPEARRRKVETFLNRNGILAPDRLAVLLDLLRIDAEAADAHAATAGVANARARTFKALLDVTDAAFARTPVMVIEDVHWADPATVEFLAMIVGVVRGLPAMLVVTARPAFAAAWTDAPHVTVLRLDRLPQPELRRLIEDLDGAEGLAPAVVDQIASRADGVPLFARELTRGLLASGRRPGGASAIPSTLTESLVARLDELRDGRRTAQIAAVIGREFPVALLAAVSPDGPEAAHEAVGRLLETGIFVRRHSSFGEAAGFSHMLLRDAAYDLLLRRERAVLHERVALTLEREFPELTAANPQLVAHHFAEAGERAKAIDYWERAALDAAGRCLPIEALAHYTTALDILAAMPPGPERDEREFCLRSERIGPLIALRGHGSEEVAGAVGHALDLHRRFGSSQSTVPLLTFQWLAQFGAGDYAALLETAGLIAATAGTGSVPERLLAHRTMGTTRLFRGEIPEALAQYEAFMALYEPEVHDRIMARAGVTSHASAVLLGFAQSFTLTDRPDERDRWRAAMFAHAQDRNHVQTFCPALLFGGCWIASMLRRFDEFAGHAEEFRRIVQRHDLALWRPHADLVSGLSAMHRGAVAEGRGTARRGIEALVAANAYGLDTWISLYVDGCDLCGCIGEGADLLPAWGARIERGERRIAADFHRLSARAAIAAGAGADAVAAAFDRAVSVAHEQGAVLLRDRAEGEFVRWRG